jgi:hypothetical protein
MARAELALSEEEWAIRQIKTDQTDGISKQTYQYILKLAKEWNVSPTNIAWLQMRPYPMQGALYQMLQSKCKKDGLIVKEMLVTSVQRATPQDKRAGFEADITLFNQRGFDDILKKIPLDGLSVELLREARELMTHRYHEEGWASLETVKAPAMQNPDYLTHMAGTRSIDRAMRMAVGCSYTAASELPDGQPGSLMAGIGGFEAPVGTEAAKPVKPGDASGAAQEAVQGVVQGAVPSLPKEKVIAQKPIKKIEAKESPKEGVVSAKQASLATLQWEAYCKSAAPSLQRADIEEKRGKLLKALFGKDQIGDLTVAQLEELIGLMARKEIELVPENTEKVEIKT